MTAPTCQQLCEEDPAFEIIEESLVGTWRHGTEHQLVVKSKETGKLYAATYRRDKDGDYNELQEGDAQIVEVRAVSKTVTEYVAVDFAK